MEYVYNRIFGVERAVPVEMLRERNIDDDKFTFV